MKKEIGSFMFPCITRKDKNYRKKIALRRVVSGNRQKLARQSDLDYYSEEYEKLD